MRIRIAVEVGKAFREIPADVLEKWLDLRGKEALEKFVGSVCGWEVVKSGAGNGYVVKVPRNKENEARSEVKSERVGVEMFGRVVRRGFEQPA